MSAEIRSALMPERQPLWPTLLLSAGGHGFIVVLFALSTLLMQTCAPKRTLIDLDDAMEVSMVVLPKADSNMPDRASVAKVNKGTEAPVKVDQPDPVKSSDLVLKKDEPKDIDPGQKVDEGDLDAALKQLEMEQALAALDAPDGSVTRSATDPNSDSDEAISIGSGPARGDPEYARYIAKVQTLFNNAFSPLPALRSSNPGISVTIHVSVDDSGNVTGYQVSKSSGVPAWDAAGERAVQAVTKVPLPPEKYRPLMRSGYEVVLK